MTKSLRANENSFVDIIWPSNMKADVRHCVNVIKIKITLSDQRI